MVLDFCGVGGVGEGSEVVEVVVAGGSVEEGLIRSVHHEADSFLGGEGSDSLQEFLPL